MVFPSSRSFSYLSPVCHDQQPALPILHTSHQLVATPSHVFHPRLHIPLLFHARDDEFKPKASGRLKSLGRVTSSTHAPTGISFRWPGTGMLGRQLDYRRRRAPTVEEAEDLARSEFLLRFISSVLYHFSRAFSHTFSRSFIDLLIDLCVSFNRQFACTSYVTWEILSNGNRRLSRHGSDRGLDLPRMVRDVYCRVQIRKALEYLNWSAIIPGPDPRDRPSATNTTEKSSSSPTVDAV